MGLKAGIEKKLSIPAAAPAPSKEGRIRELACRSAKSMDRSAHAIDSELVCHRVMHNTSPADVFPARFELRFDEHDGLQGGHRALSHRGDHRRQDQSGRNERHVHGYKPDSPGQIAGFEVTGVGTLQQGHAGISAQAFGDLPIAGIDRDDAGRAMLQHAVRKTAGGGADIDAVTPGEIDLPLDQCGFQLQPAPADVALFFPQHAQQRSVLDSAPGLLYFLLVDEHAPGENERLRPFPRRRQTMLDQQLIQAVPHLEWEGFLSLRRYAAHCIRCFLGTLVWLFPWCNRRMGSAQAMPDKTPNPIGQPERSTISDANLKDRMSDGSTSAVNDDSALLQRVRQGDQTAMAEVFDRYSRAVYSVALRILKDSGHAEDVMQEIFFQIWRNSDSFVQGRGSLGAWLVVVARNRSIDLLRRRKPTDSVEDVVLASSCNLAAEAEHNAMIEKVQKVLQDLPAEQQKSMEMAFFEGLSHSEIAERTGDPLGTVKTRIRLALITLRKAFQA
jgi:RNA polymerase sigma-70 factor (ECF subfamily)